MKRHMMGVFFLIATSFHAWADRGAPPDPAKFKAEKAACEAAQSQFNMSGITLPDGPPAPGQHPQLNDEQHALIKACIEAGIMKPHHHHHDEAPPAGE